MGAVGLAARSVPAEPSPGQTGVWGEDEASTIPTAIPSARPVSSTFAPARAVAGSATLAPPRPLRDPYDVTDAGDSPPTKERIEYILPPITTLDDIALPISAGGDRAAHERNEEIIVKKLAGFGIPAKIVGRNAGPVVTQYEVQPAPRRQGQPHRGAVGRPRDGAGRALAADRGTDPGKSAVGIEIPNKDFNVVALRRILEEVRLQGVGLDADVRPRPRRRRQGPGGRPGQDAAPADRRRDGLGQERHGQRPDHEPAVRGHADDVRMILMDLKRVELAAYNGLPHLLVPVITEPERAKAALKWAVNEMEARYRRLAGASARATSGVQRDPGRPRGPDALHRDHRRRAAPT